MAQISSKRRHFQIKAKHKRKRKLKKLRLKYQAAKTSSRKEKILAKVHRISPLLSKEEFLKPTENSSAKA